MDHDAAPLAVTTTATALTLSHPADTSAPPSPSALAAATTLAALADDRPLPALHPAHEYAHYYDGEDDDDYSGGISITSADLHEYTAGHPVADTYMTEQDVAEYLESMAPPPPPVQETLPGLVNALPPMPTFQMASALEAGHTSSSESTPYWALDPLPTAFGGEAQLAIEDNGCFTDITAFFDRIAPQRPTVPGLDLVQVPAHIARDQLEGDRFDHQGIDWLARNTTRSYVRAKRAEFEASRVARRLHVRDVQSAISPIPNSDSFFRFKRNNTAHRAFFPHFQLRNVLAATSRNDIYYAAGHHVLRTDAEGWQKDVIIDFSSRLSIKGSITTIASAGDVLIAGAFDGEYAITDLSSTYDATPTFGRTSDIMVETRSRIVNHMHLFEGRTTYNPQAVLCSNDHHLRILDCATNRFTHNFGFPAAVNCSATSPDGRLRVVVGDFQETLITNAETGEIFEMLKSHTDDAFACAWADDGYHVASASQDSTISIWDARCWGKDPLTSFTSEIGVTRSLRFSPVGSGPRVLVAAEADDYVSIINAQTFESKQVFDFFGPIGGTAFTPDGQSLFIANGEKTFGGIVELDRTGWAERTAERKPDQDIIWDDLTTDWIEDDRLDEYDLTLSSPVERERRCVDFGNMIV